MSLEIFAAESLGVRGLCCLVTFRDRCVIIDPGVSLGYVRHGLLPHPLQIAEGCKVREKIIHALNNATDVVFSHFHGDHVPLLDANPYQLSLREVPPRFHEICCWSKSEIDLSSKMSKRFHDLADLIGENMKNAEGLVEGPLSFSQAVPHGVLNSNSGTLMMTRIKMDNNVFVHASDIQLLDDSTVDRVIDWQPDIVLAAGPPLYLDQLSKLERECAWRNALRLATNIDVVILDHHLMRSVEGEVWLDELSAAVSKKVYCAADFMGSPRKLFEAKRVQLYKNMPVPDGWHDDYAKGLVSTGEYSDPLSYEDVHDVNGNHGNNGYEH
jgi:predicted metallo-beta-lactamase superfamily hydrolase